MYVVLFVFLFLPRSLSRVFFSHFHSFSRLSLSLSHFHMICTARSTYVRGDYEGEWWCIGAVRTRRTPPLWAPYRAITRLLTITEYLLAARFHFDIRPLPHFVFSSSILALSSVSLSLLFCSLPRTRKIDLSFASTLTYFINYI